MKTLYMIGNAHLDPVWLWPWQEGFQENKATCQSALERLEEYDEVVFTSSSAQFYEWIEKNDKDMFSKISRKIKEGRWILCGGWWIQPDCNIPSGESFARHALLAQNYFQEKFGVIAKTGYNVDSFGHNGMLPQILKLSGMENYVFMRPGTHEKGLPGRNFIWESDDGSKVHAFRIPFSYCTFGNLEEHMKACKQEFDAGVNQLMCFYGVGNHGGGPTKENIEIIKRLQKEWKDINIVFSDPDTYFEDLIKSHNELPVVHGDLQHHASGCYSAQSEIKRLNRQSENVLIRAEKFGVLSEIVSGLAFADNFAEGWKRVLFNQFHDILAGSGIEQTYDDARNEIGEALAIAARNENNSLQAISFKIQIEQEKDMLPIVVFNPHSWSVREKVEVEIGMFQNSCKGEYFIVRNSEDKEIPVQKIAAEAKVKGRTRVVFEAEVPALGYAVFRLYAVENTEEYKESKEKFILENKSLRIRFDGKTGGIKSLWCKKEQAELCSDILGRAAVIQDTSDTWSHDVVRFQDIEGYFEPVSVKKIEEGPVRDSIRVISKYKKSTLTQVYTLYKNEERIRVSAKINWQEKFRCVKLQFPVNVGQYHGTYEIPFGNIEKSCNGEEEPVQRWVDLTGIQEENHKLVCGLSVINDGKYSASIEKNRMDLTVLRSPVYAHHNPYILEDDEDEYSFIDQGIQRFKYELVPHMGSWREAGLPQRAEELNQPCVTIIETYHHGIYPQKAGYIRVEDENIVLSALKRAYDGNGYIARFYETSGMRTETELVLDLFGKKVSAVFNPYEIKTFRFTEEPESEVIETNFLEWERDK